MKRTIRSLDCWARYGCAGQRNTDAFAAREALLHHCCYGINEMGRLVFVYLPNQNLKVEREIQAERIGDTRATQEIPTFMLSRLLRESREDELVPLILDGDDLILEAVL